MKLSSLLTKTFASDTPEGLDGAITEFKKTLAEETFLDLSFQISASAAVFGSDNQLLRDSGVKYAAILSYTG